MTQKEKALRALIEAAKERSRASRSAADKVDRAAIVSRLWDRLLDEREMR